MMPVAKRKDLRGSDSKGNTDSWSRLAFACIQTGHKRVELDDEIRFSFGLHIGHEN